MKKHILGIDIGKKVHAATLVNEEGKVVASFKFKNNKAGYDKVTKHIDKWVDDKESLTIGMEATGHYWLTAYQYFTNYGLEVIVLNPLQTASFRNTNIRGIKTDKEDGKFIAEIVRFQAAPVYLPDATLIGLKQLTRFRTDLMRQIASVKLKLISVLDQVFPEFDSLFSDIAGKTSLTILERYTTPEEINTVKTKDLTTIIKKASRSRLGRQTAYSLKQLSDESIGLTIGIDAFSLQIQLLVEQIKHLEAQVKKLEEVIEKLFKKQENTLTSIPGISTTIAATITAEISNIARFAKVKDPAKALTAYAGLDAKPKDSGNKKGKRVMSKRGSRYLRTAIWQAAFTASQHDPMFKKVYQKQIDKGKHHYVAVSHVARKMVNVIYSLLASGKIYQPILTD